MTREEAIETTKIYSACGKLPRGVPLVHTRPFRAPHHSISIAGLCGGGMIPKPGEISLAHNGVLFLDELPSRFMLAAAMNPCPCGYFGHPTRSCRCTPGKVSAYLGKISGPLLSRLDLHVEVLPVDYQSLSSRTPQESSKEVKTRVMAARKIQQERYKGKIFCNAQIPPGNLAQVCPLTGKADQVLKAAFEKLGFSGRAYDRILKVARTIADMEGCETIGADHISEAVQYRTLDRKYWKS